MSVYQPPLPTEECRSEQHARDGGCSWCCDSCNYDRHICLFCGDPLRHDGRLWNGETNTCYMSDDEYAMHIGTRS